MAVASKYVPGIPVYDGLVDTDGWFPVQLLDNTDGVTQETGIAFGSIEVKYAKLDGSATLGSYTVTTNDWQEAGEGLYGIRIGASEFDSAGNWIVRVADTTPEGRKIAFMVDVAARELDGVTAAGGVILADTTHGGSSATLELDTLTITSSSGTAVTVAAGGVAGIGISVAGSGTGAAIQQVGGAEGQGHYIKGGSTSGSALKIEADGTNDIGIEVIGLGSGSGVQVTPGATGKGLYVKGGATSGVAALLEAQAGNTNAATFTPTGSGLAIGAANLTSIETDTADLQGRIPAALIGGRLDVHVGAWAGGTATKSTTTGLPEVDTKSISDNTAAADAVQANIANLDAAISGRSTLTQSQVTGGAYALDTDANGRVRVVSGTAAGEISLSSGLVSLNKAQTLSGETAGTVGKALENSIDNLDAAVSTRSAPATAQTINLTTVLSESPTAGSIGDALLHALAAQKYRNKSSGNGGTIKIYKSDGTTVLTSRNISADGLELTT